MLCAFRPSFGNPSNKGDSEPPNRPSGCQTDDLRAKILRSRPIRSAMDHRCIFRQLSTKTGVRVLEAIGTKFYGRSGAIICLRSHSGRKRGTRDRCHRRLNNVVTKHAPSRQLTLENCARSFTPPCICFGVLRTGSQTTAPAKTPLFTPALLRLLVYFQCFGRNIETK